VALLIAYEGTDWSGWQTQPGGIAIQDQIESALGVIAGKHVATVCAGRTDAGVHARSQVIHFDPPIERSLIAWTRGPNALMPASISVLEAARVSPDFHARFSALRREYTYAIYRGAHRHALYARQHAWVFQSLDLAAMQRAAQALCGTHDFSAFRSSQCQAKTPVRTIEQIHWTEEGPTIRMVIVGNAFLHHMVRNIVGSLLWIGMGRRPAEWLAQLLESRDRRLAAMTAPAQGLCLTGVDYGPDFTLRSWSNPHECPRP
jgi:tRNA pseudouridine38-40 synthase